MLRFNNIFTIYIGFDFWSENVLKRMIQSNYSTLQVVVWALSIGQLNWGNLVT